MSVMTNNKDRQQEAAPNQGADTPVHNLYHGAQPIELATAKIKFQSPEAWIAEGMKPELPPEYRLPADIADMKRPEGMTRYQARLMHLVFATMCRNRSPRFLIGRKEIGKFVTGNEKNIRSDRIDATISGLAELKFVFAATGLRLRNLKPWEPSSLFASKPKISRQKIAFEIHPDIYQRFLDPKIYEFVSLEVIRRLRSEPALFIYPASQIRLRIKAQRTLRDLRKTHDFSEPTVDTEGGFPSRIEDISTWLGLKYVEPGRVLSDLKRAATALAKDMGEGGLPRIDVFGVKKDERGKVYKDEAKKKYILFDMLLPARSLFYEDLNQSQHDYYHYRLNAPHALFVKPGHMKATATAIGWNPVEPISAKAIKVAWMKHVVELGDRLFSYNQISQVYSEFHAKMVEEYRMKTTVELPKDDEMQAITAAWDRLGRMPDLKEAEKLKHIPDIPRAHSALATNDDVEVKYDRMGLKMTRPAIKARHPKLSTLEVGQRYLRDPRDHSVIFDAHTFEVVEPGSSDWDIMDIMFGIKPDQIPFLNHEQIDKVYAKRRTPPHLDRLLKARKIVSKMDSK